MEQGKRTGIDLSVQTLSIQRMVAAGIAVLGAGCCQVLYHQPVGEARQYGEDY